MVILGDVNFEEIKESVTKLLSAWESKEVVSKSFPKPTNPENTEIIFVKTFLIDYGVFKIATKIWVRNTSWDFF